MGAIVLVGVILSFVRIIVLVGDLVVGPWLLLLAISVASSVDTEVVVKLFIAVAKLEPEV